MKIGSGLAVICVGAILAFAVTTNTSVFNLHTAGWVLMLIGIIGLLLPDRTYGWLGRRMQVRRTYPSGRVEHITQQPYVPRVSALEQGVPSRPTLLDQEDDLIDETTSSYDVIQETEPPATRRTPSGQAQAHGPRPRVTEVIEDVYEEP
jgi:hypothetical protein